MGPTVSRVVIDETVVSAVQALVAVMASMTLGSFRGRLMKATPWDAIVNLLVVPQRVEARPANWSGQVPDAIPSIAETEDAEARLARAEQNWRSSFRRRASVMKGALRLATNEDLPTPRTDDDD